MNLNVASRWIMGSGFAEVNGWEGPTCQVFPILGFALDFVAVLFFFSFFLSSSDLQLGLCVCVFFSSSHSRCLP